MNNLYNQTHYGEAVEYERDEIFKAPRKKKKIIFKGPRQIES